LDIIKSIAVESANVKSAIVFKAKIDPIIFDAICCGTRLVSPIVEVTILFLLYN
jgi:hypothetical protein